MKSLKAKFRKTDVSTSTHVVVHVDATMCAQLSHRLWTSGWLMAGFFFFFSLRSAGPEGSLVSSFYWNPLNKVPGCVREKKEGVPGLCRWLTLVNTKHLRRSVFTRQLPSAAAAEQVMRLKKKKCSEGVTRLWKTRYGNMTFCLPHRENSCRFSHFFLVSRPATVGVSEASERPLTQREPAEGRASG